MSHKDAYDLRFLPFISAKTQVFKFWQVSQIPVFLKKFFE